MWTEANYPVGWPGDDAHWSPLVGATFADLDAFWGRAAAAPGSSTRVAEALPRRASRPSSRLGKGTASPGVKLVAETGDPATLQSELDDGKYLDVATHAGPVFAADEFKMEIMLEADAMHDQLGLISMIAPSPDWFTGVSSVDLCDYSTGEWMDEFSMMLKAYRAAREVPTSTRVDR